MNHLAKKETIVVVGYGWVGQANALALKTMGYPVAYFDIGSPVENYPEFGSTYSGIRPLKGVLELDGDQTWYIVCVGDKVLPDGTQDISAIEKALASLEHAKGKVILRSTVLPRLLSRLKFDCYMPEFLHEKRGVLECIQPYYFVVGIRGTYDWPTFIKRWMKSTDRIFTGTPEEAAYIKYLSNIWNASRIALVNEFGDAMLDRGLDERQAEGVIDFIFGKKNYLKYGKSFGGHCLPKDMSAFSRDHGSVLFQAALASNEAHKVMETRRTLHEWFSYWDHQTSTMGFRKLFTILLKKSRPAAIWHSVMLKTRPVARFLMAARRERE